MLRQNIFSENPDSDHSISDEEEFDREWPENCISLAGSAKNKKQTSFSLEDEGDIIHAPRKAFTFNSDEEMISDDEENNVLSKFSITSGAAKFQKVNLHSFGIGKQDEAYTWSTISKEAEALVRLNESASCSSSNSTYSKANKLCKGVGGRAKPKFSFRFQSHKGELSWPFIPKDGNGVSSKDENDASYKVHEVPEGLETIERRVPESSMAEIFEDFQEEKEKQLVVCKVHTGVEAVGHGYTKHSMAELLDGLQDKTVLLRGKPTGYNKTKGRSVQLVVKRSISTLGDRSIDNEDPPDKPLGSGSSSDDEANDQSLKLAIPEIKRKTMADRFQEALGAACLNDEGALFAVPKPLGIGLFGKLQQVMQAEKERDADFLKKLQTGAIPNDDEASCIDVTILSRYLDAKLTVCHCYSGKTKESPQWPESLQTTRENGGRKRTVIFNSRVCGDVELEVGNLIRIHPPWKEVKAMDNDESIILSTYFSQITI